MKRKLSSAAGGNGASHPQGLEKAPTGIAGLDEITFGGLPKGRPTLICGGAGCGKTLMGVEFLIRGAVDYDEPGVLMAFEETEDDLAKNVASLGYDLKELIGKKKLVIDYVHIERSEIEEAGEFDLEGLFIRLGSAIDAIGAKRVVLDTIEAIFSGFPNPNILRAELRRLFRWLKNKGVTAVITGERGQGALTRQGLEEYVSDCVILLDHRVTDQISTRRLRVVKYRGSTHGTNEYPFLIDEQGLSVLPVTSLGLEHKVSSERVSSGIARLDTMLGGGYFRGSTVLISGTAGTGKSSIANHFVDATCRTGERCLYLASEESCAQIIRNMRSIGIDQAPWVKKGLLRFDAERPHVYGLEMHLLRMHKLISEYKPAAVVVDPITNYLSLGDNLEVKSMLIRLLDFLKSNGITAIFTSLTQGGGALEATTVGVSSLIDTWLLLRDIEANGERNRGLYVIKSRGMAHSNQIREFLLTSHGAELLDVYVGTEGVLTGSARVAQEAKESAAAAVRRQEIERKQRELERKRKALQAQIAALHAAYEVESQELEIGLAEERLREEKMAAGRIEMARLRKAEVGNGKERGKNNRKGAPA
ncbi:MAG TPA: circadian clock protein KaiC [Verrucomicrobiae bacterium]|nr:circadian clock protein KaiC [Verrucomicrobiae bacterium]